MRAAEPAHLRGRADGCAACPHAAAGEPLAAACNHACMCCMDPACHPACTPCVAVRTPRFQMHTQYAEGDGTKVYASCLAFYDELPAELRARHPELCGGRALKALCLLSRQPYLATSERVSWAAAGLSGTHLHACVLLGATAWRRDDACRRMRGASQAPTPPRTC